MNSRASRYWSWATAGALISTSNACGPTARPSVGAAPSPSQAAARDVARDPADAALPSAATATIAAPVPSAPVALPEHIRPGELVRVALPGYRAALVAHGKPGTTRAMIYLHGVCGNVYKIRDWVAVAANHVTTIALHGNKPCPTAPATASWNQDVEFIHELIQTALGRVSEARGGQLDVSRAAVFGYSQGASRAERLVERYPDHYPWLIVGGPPAVPRFERVSAAHRTVILVGSEEHQEHLANVAREFSSHGAPTRFAVFPGAGHGSFGRDAPRVMEETLSWLLDESPIAAASGASN